MNTVPKPNLEKYMKERKLDKVNIDQRNLK